MSYTYKGGTFEEAMSFALEIKEDCSVMLDRKKRTYHVIRAYAVPHWKRYYSLISNIKMVPKITGRKP